MYIHQSPWKKRDAFTFHQIPTLHHPSPLGFPGRFTCTGSCLRPRGIYAISKSNAMQDLKCRGGEGSFTKCLMNMKFRDMIENKKSQVIQKKYIKVINPMLLKHIATVLLVDALCSLYFPCCNKKTSAV